MENNSSISPSHLEGGRESHISWFCPPTQLNQEKMGVSEHFPQGPYETHFYFADRKITIHKWLNDKKTTGFKLTTIYPRGYIIFRLRVIHWELCTQIGKGEQKLLWNRDILPELRKRQGLREWEQGRIMVGREGLDLLLLRPWLPRSMHSKGSQVILLKTKTPFCLHSQFCITQLTGLQLASLCHSQSMGIQVLEYN